MLYQLDSVDIALLSIIERNSNITNSALAEKLNLSTSACWERRHRLEAAGIICGYRARIAVEKLTPFMSALVTIELKNHTLPDAQRFEAAVKQADAIVDCYNVVGVIDYLLRVVTRDISSFQQLMDDLLAKDIGIERYFTYIVTRVIKSFPGSLDFPAALFLKPNQRVDL